MHGFRFGPYCLGPDQTLWCEGRMVPLAPMQRRLLACFCRHRGRVVSKQELIQEVWGNDQASEISLARTVHGLRRKLADKYVSPELIQTVYGHGYVFTASVEQLPPDIDAMLLSQEASLIA
jgi:DNA-binding winged helix-turn-helix (wHTH) protein